MLSIQRISERAEVTAVIATSSNNLSQDAGIRHSLNQTIAAGAKQRPNQSAIGAGDNGFEYLSLSDRLVLKQVDAEPGQSAFTLLSCTPMRTGFLNQDTFSCWHSF